MEVSRATDSQQMYAVQQEAAPAEDADMTEVEFEQQFMQTILRLKEPQATLMWHNPSEQDS